MNGAIVDAESWLHRVWQRCHPLCQCCGAQTKQSGIYVGDGEIVRLNGDGKIERVGAQEFLARLDGFNPAISINVAYDESSVPKGRRPIDQRALSQLGQ